ncbi:hypothetical protein Holit_01548 [Hollandina sp. SP2]
MIPVGICHAFKRFLSWHSRAQDHPFPRKQFVKPFLSLAQLMLLTWFFRYPIVHMQLFYPKNGVYTDCLVKRFPTTVLIHLEIVFAPFSFPDIYNVHGFLFYDDLRLYPMPLFLA